MHRRILIIFAIVGLLARTGQIAAAQTLLRVATPGAFTGAIPPYKFFDLSLIQELKAEGK